MANKSASTTITAETPVTSAETTVTVDVGTGTIDDTTNEGGDTVTSDDTVIVTVIAGMENPDPARLMINGLTLPVLWQGVPTEFPRDCLHALVDSGVTFTTSHKE